MVEVLSVITIMKSSSHFVILTNNRRTAVERDGEDKC